MDGACTVVGRVCLVRVRFTFTTSTGEEWAVAEEMTLGQKWRAPVLRVTTEFTGDEDMSIRTTNEEIIQAYMETGSVWKAAKKLGLCGQSVWERLRRLNIPLTHAEWTDEEEAQAVQMAQGGIPISRIAAAIGRTYAAVASRLSRKEIKHPYQPVKKPRRGQGLTKARILKLWKHVDSGWSIAKSARWTGTTTTGLVNAMQNLTPDRWKDYVERHSDLPLERCPGCARPFLKLTKKQLYCSNKCGMNARADARYFGGKRLSTIGLSEGVCQLCMKKIKKGLSSHHLFGKENDPENEYLIALCPGCHNLVTILSRWGQVQSKELWENLIILTCLRAQGQNKPLGFHVMVDIDELSEEDLDIPEQKELPLVI